MEVFEKQGAEVRISPDEMEASLYLIKPEEKTEYTMADLLELLQKHHITFGIDMKAVELMQKGAIYQREVCVARGIRPVDGQDGYYLYNFDMDLNRKPTVREDGSVDYWSVHAVELVEAGQVIATYNEPISGQDGTTVTGKPIKAKRGRPLPPIAGKGFSRSEDGNTYTADVTGKIEMLNNRIIISSVYEVRGDVDLRTGNIDFRGDVVIHGNVTAGAVVKASGTITVDGICEACTLEAGKGILLRGGVLGGEKAVIRSKKDIQAKFFEYCYVEAEGCIRLTSALNCKLVSYEKIYLVGKRAGLVGGDVYATCGIEADTLGNINEVKTQVHVGTSAEILHGIFELESQIRDDNSLLDKVNDGLAMIDNLAKASNTDPNSDDRKVALLRAKLAKQAEIAQKMKDLERLNEIVKRGQDATVQVLREVYPNTIVMIDQSTLVIKDEQRSILFKKKDGNVVMHRLGDVVD